MTGKGVTELNLDERLIIEAGLARGDKTGTIASIIGRSHSCVKQEIRKNGGKNNYKARDAHSRSMERRSMSIEKKSFPLSNEEHLRVVDFINQGFSRDRTAREMGITNYRLKKHFEKTGLKYKTKHLGGLEERVNSIEMQLEIAIDAIKELTKFMNSSRK